MKRKSENNIDNLEIPNTLYKYRHFDKKGHTINMLKNGGIWFASANNFNDPFDTSITFNFNGLYDEIAEKWARKAIDKFLPNASSKKKENVVKERLKKIRSSEYIKKFKNKMINDQYNKFGICPLSASRKNLLLWAHYTKNHTGICIGYNSNKLLKYAEKLAKQGELLDLQPIKYKKELPDINFFQAMLKQNNSFLNTFIYTKSKHWSYEKEYRLVYWDHVKHLLKINPSIISEIIFGCYIQPKNQEKVLKICSSFKHKPKSYKAKKSKDKFKLNFKQLKIER